MGEMIQDIYDAVLEMWQEAKFDNDHIALKFITDIDNKFLKFANTWNLHIHGLDDDSFLEDEDDG